jgi:hypothetical protein
VISEVFNHRRLIDNAGYILGFFANMYNSMFADENERDAPGKLRDEQIEKINEEAEKLNKKHAEEKGDKMSISDLYDLLPSLGFCETKSFDQLVKMNDKLVDVEDRIKSRMSSKLTLERSLFEQANKDQSFAREVRGFEEVRDDEEVREDKDGRGYENFPDIDKVSFGNVSRDQEFARDLFEYQSGLTPGEEPSGEEPSGEEPSGEEPSSEEPSTTRKFSLAEVMGMSLDADKDDNDADDGKENDDDL